MALTDILEKIRAGIHQSYISNETILLEPDENMSIPLYKGDSDIVLIKPKDNEKERLWACLSSSTEREIADYIAFAIIDKQIICFILELKKTKTLDSNKKASKQIISTHPLVKLIYEKTTGINPKNLKTVGIRVFGPAGKKRQAKQSRKDKTDVDADMKKDLLAIGYFVQSNNTSNMCSLASLYKLIKEKHRW